MRATFALLPAVLVTLALFFLMHIMISGRGESLNRIEDFGVVDFVRLQSEPEESLKARPQRSLPQRPQGPPSPPLPPGLAAAANATPVAPELVAEMPGPGKPGLGEPPPLSSLVASIQKPKVRKAPPVPRTRPRKNLPSGNVAGRPTKPSVPGADLAGAKVALAAPAGEVGGVEAAAPGLGGAGDGEVIPLFRIEPVYPRKAARAGKEGWVKVEFTVSKSGTVTEASVVESRPRRIFDRSALKAIRKWRFKPRVADGEAVSRRATQVFEFKLAEN